MKLNSTLSPQQIFSQVAKPNIQRSTFPRPHFRSGTFPAGKLIPLSWDLVYPGDTMKMNISGAIRYNTLIKPVQANQYLDFHSFFVPLRLIHDDFKKMMGEQVDPTDSISFIVPYITIPAGGMPEASNYDALGVPIGRGAGVEISAYPLRALHACWNRWFRDENLQDSVYCPTDAGPDTATNYDDYLPRGKRKDAFTSALPFPQKGDAVTIELGTSAPVVYITGGATPGIARWSASDNLATSQTTLTTNASGHTAIGGGAFFYDPNGTLEADLSSASLITINALREYNMLQCYLENDARGGTRYNEMTYSHFGVLSEDSRVQDPELIGYYSTLVDVTAIPQQSEDGATPQGNLAAMGTINFLGKHLYNKSFTEHGITITVASVRTDQVYQQGLHRNWSISSRFDFYSPEFAHLGEEFIPNQEIYLQDASVVDGSGNPVNENAFGYQERFYHMRYMESYVFGAYRSESATPLDSWHLAQEFATLPLLDSDFIIEDAPIDRIVAVNTEPDFNGEFHFDYNCTRPMPVRSIPSLMDRM